MIKIQRKMIQSPLYGKFQSIIRKQLQRKYKFDEWHVLPMYTKKYLSEIYYILESEEICYTDDSFVEIGCGLGDIIGNLNVKMTKYGYDISPEVIRAAHLLYKNVRFQVGSFDQIHIGNIGCLIMVNFIHTMEEKELTQLIQKLLDDNNVTFVLFDIVERIKYSEYLCSHDGNRFLNGRFECCYRGSDYIAAHGAKRHIELWKARR